MDQRRRLRNPNSPSITSNPLELKQSALDLDLRNSLQTTMRTMSLPAASSSSYRHSKLFFRCLLKTHTLVTSVLLRRLSTETTTPGSPPPQEHQQQPTHSPLLQGNDNSIIAEAIQLLQKPEQEWITNSQLYHLLLSSSSSPRLFLQITRRLPSSSHALKLLHYIQSNSSSEDCLPLSYIFQAIFELAGGDIANLSILYKTSKELNVPLTVNAAILLLRCLGKGGLVEDCIWLFNELDESAKNTHVRNALIDILMRAGRLDDALKVLDEMLQSNAESDYGPDDFTGDIVFSGLWKKGRPGRRMNEEEIVDLALRFGQRGVFMKSYWMTKLITSLSRLGRMNRAWELLNELLKLEGGGVDTASCNSLLTCLSRNNESERMNELMAKMKEANIQPNVITFGILIKHLCRVRRVDQALEVLQNMSGGQQTDDGVSVEPDIVIYNTVIDGLCKVGRQEEGFSLMEKMRSRNGCAPGTVTYNTLIDGFCKAGELEKGEELFAEMKKLGVVPNVITVNTLVDGMCRHGKVRSALEFFEEMRSQGLKGSAFAYTSLITAFCYVNNIAKAMELFDRMLEDRWSPDATAYYSLISGLCQAGRMKDARAVFSKFKEAGFRPDIICYNMMVSGFCKKNKLDEVKEIMKDMDEAGVRPNGVTYNTLISYSSKAGDFKVAHDLLRKMTKEGLVPTVVTFGALIHAYCLHDKIDEAMKIFRDMGTTTRIPPSTVIYNILIDSLCKKGDVERAISLMDDMRVKGVRPNTTTYNAMFKGLQDKKMLKKAFELMDKMVEQACDPDYITMEILTLWLPAVGETERLKKFVQGYTISDSTLECGFHG